MTKTHAVATIMIGAAWLALAVHAAEPAAQPATQPSTSPATQPASQPGKELTLDLGNKVTMKLVLIPAGKFMMGSPKEEKDRFDNEGPQREVTLTKPFYMGVYEVTQAQYEAVMGANPSRYKGPTNPVESVSWDEAAEFSKKLSEKAGRAVRLPTEAEWEYACRAGTQTAFSFGDDPLALGDYAWHGRNSGDTTHPVGQKKPNAWGLFDMLGNVQEWCADWKGDSFGKGPSKDPSGPATGELRVQRGGSYFNSSADAYRCARSESDYPANRSGSRGLRCVTALP